MIRLKVAGLEQCLPEKWPVRRWGDHSPGGRDNQLLQTVSVWKERSPVLAFERRRWDDRMMNFNGPSDILNSIFHFKCTSKSSTYRMQAKSFSSNQQGHRQHPHGRLPDKNTLDFQTARDSLFHLGKWHPDDLKLPLQLLRTLASAVHLSQVAQESLAKTFGACSPGPACFSWLLGKGQVNMGLTSW